MAKHCGKNHSQLPKQHLSVCRSMALPQLAPGTEFWQVVAGTLLPGTRSFSVPSGVLLFPQMVRSYLCPGLGEEQPRGAQPVFVR